MSSKVTTTSLVYCVETVREWYENGQFTHDEKTDVYKSTARGPIGTSWWPTRITVDGRKWRIQPGFQEMGNKTPSVIDDKEWQAYEASHHMDDLFNN